MRIESLMDLRMVYTPGVASVCELIAQHPEAAWEIFAGSAPELQDELNEKAWADTLPRFALRPAALDRERYRRFEAFLVEAGLVAEPWPVERLAVEVGVP